VGQSYPTINQQSKNYAYWSSGRRDEDFGFGASQRARNGTDPQVIWQLPDNWQGYLLSKIFSQSQIRSMAIAIDPSRNFVSNVAQIAPMNRTRKKGTNGYFIGAKGTLRIIISSNFTGGNQNNIVPEYVISDDIGDLFTSNVEYETRFEDSTQKLRPKGVHYSSMRSAKTENIWKSSNLGTQSVTLNQRVFPRTDINANAFVRTVSIYTFIIEPDNPIVAPYSNWTTNVGIEQFTDNVKSVCKDLLPEVLTPCLTSARKFNAFYQLGELRDLPLMIKKTQELVELLRQLSRKQGSALKNFDKSSADAYLNLQFGYKSMASAVKSLLKLPEELAKRFNYLLERNRKRTSQRYKKIYENLLDVELFKPGYASLVDYVPSFEVRDSEELTTQLELRCVVNTEVNFPPLAVPKYRNSKYLDLIGLYPRLTDFYNLIPWTWLIDWFTGLSGYINLVETIANDDDLINYGFLTAVIDCQASVAGRIVLRDLVEDYDTVNDSYLQQTWSAPRDVPYATKSTMKYRLRFNIADLDGVKSASNEQGQLSDYQVSIIGALLTKFTGKKL
jgi:hypothetical protein